MSDSKKFISKEDLINRLSSFLRTIGKMAETEDCDAIKREVRLALRICEDSK